MGYPPQGKTMHNKNRHNQKLRKNFKRTRSKRSCMDIGHIEVKKTTNEIFQQLLKRKKMQ